MDHILHNELLTEQVPQPVCAVAPCRTAVWEGGTGGTAVIDEELADRQVGRQWQLFSTTMANSCTKAAQHTLQQK
jgi:hypothetical protein